MLVVRSRTGVYDFVRALLRAGNCRTLITRAYIVNVAVFVSCGPSLIVLSLNLPSQSNLSTVHSVQRGCLAPVVILSTHAARRSGVRTLSLNTGSCVAGPFNANRLLTQIQTTLQIGHCNNNDLPNKIFDTRNLAVGCRHHGIFISKRRIHLARARCGVITFLSRRTKHIVACTTVIQTV